jgi:nitroreductase
VDLVGRRQSVRRYLDRPVERETAGPIGTFNTFTNQAPVLVAAVTQAPLLRTRIGGLLKGRDYSLIDIGIAAAHFCLQATELGLGTCMLGWFGEPAVKRALGIPRGRRVHRLITLGYPADLALRPKRRKSLVQVHSYNRYQD